MHTFPSDSTPTDFAGWYLCSTTGAPVPNVAGDLTNGSPPRVSEVSPMTQVRSYERKRISFERFPRPRECSLRKEVFRDFETKGRMCEGERHANGERSTVG